MAVFFTLVQRRALTICRFKICKRCLKFPEVEGFGFRDTLCIQNQNLSQFWWDSIYREFAAEDSWTGDFEVRFSDDNRSNPLINSTHGKLISCQSCLLSLASNLRMNKDAKVVIHEEESLRFSLPTLDFISLDPLLRLPHFNLVDLN